ncbi:MAG: Ig-like domain-containing protein [Syntrophomonadaceae bacterium]
MQCNSKAKLLVFLVLAALIVLPFTAFAEGDGSGGGQNQPLALLASTPADGAQNVALDTQIKLSFNKNVVNMSVASNNRKCFTITQGQNNIAFDVVMADDQVQPEGKRDIVLVPRSSLLPGSTYKVIISAGLQAKNESSLTQATSITFTTAGAAPKAPAANEATPSQAEAAKPAPNAVETQPEASSNNSSLTAPVDATQKDASQATSESTTQGNSETTGRTVKGLTYAGIIVLLGAGGVILYWRKRK